AKPEEPTKDEPVDLDYKPPKIEPLRIPGPSAELQDTLPRILESDFNQEVLAANMPTLVFFFHRLEDACKATLPAVIEIARDYSGKVKVVEVDVQVNKNVFHRYGADYFNVPVLSLFKNGAEQGRISSAASKQSIMQLIE